MKNPYEILGVSQDANNPQILKAMTTAMRKKEYSNTDIAQARAQLSSGLGNVCIRILFFSHSRCHSLKYLWIIGILRHT